MNSSVPWIVVIHGGAGGITRAAPPRHEQVVRATLADALTAAGDLLHANGSAIDAVQAAVVVMEDSPVFNAGRGAVFTADGTHELDASIMRGDDLAAGAVAGVRRVKNPILAARAVLDRSPHVLLAGAGADVFAEQTGLMMVDPAYFSTEERRLQLVRAQEADAQLPLAALANPSDAKYGTVGAVALDRHGNLAAATSTGGLTNKRFGRVGDSALFGAGTFADNRSAAVSATGQGEFFIRLAAAHAICARIELGGCSLADAADEVINRRLRDLGGEGGVIAVDRAGEFVMTMNTLGMNRGVLREGCIASVKLFADE